MTRSGTCVAIGARGVLLCGPSGTGKSDLALRLIDGGGELVADDRVLLELSGGALLASAPPALRGLLEVRGIGIVRLPYRSCVPVALLVDLADRPAVRLPEPTAATIHGHGLPVLRLAAGSASAAARVRLALGPAESVAGALGDAA